jgi:hypothetical protein
MTGADDRSFVIETQDGPLRVVVSAAVLRPFAGRSHVTVAEVFDIYRSELEDAARAKAKRNGSKSMVRLEATDL